MALSSSSSVSSLYNTPGHIVYATDFRYDICIHTHPMYAYQCWLIWPVWWAYLFLAHILQQHVNEELQLVVFCTIYAKNVKSMPCSMMAVQAINAVWQPYLLSDLQVYVQCSHGMVGGSGIKLGPYMWIHIPSKPQNIVDGCFSFCFISMYKLNKVQFFFL